MASDDNEIVTDFYPHIRIYKNGRVERFYHLHNVFYVPPTQDPDQDTDVSSKDVTMNSHVSARLYLPNIKTNQKLSIILFYHGGGLILGSAFFHKCHRFLDLLISESNSIVVSIDYSDDNEIVTDFYPHIRIYKNGRVERFYHLHNIFYVPPTQDPDPDTGVSSKDVTINSHVSARLYLPNIKTNQKLPIILFYHGGGLILGSAFFNKYHHFLDLLVSESNSIVVSVDYRLAPEYDVFTIHEDCWTTLQWVASSQDTWLTNHGDFNKIFLVGESGGANIVFNMTMRAGREKLYRDVKINGSILACPCFLIPHKNIDMENLSTYKLWTEVLCPKLESGESPLDCPMVNPLSKLGPSLSGLGCSKLLVCIAEKDEMAPEEMEMQFIEGVKKSGWNGEFVFFVVEGEGHSFFIEDLETESTRDLIKRFTSFIQN